jgi:hypothetical protein
VADEWLVWRLVLEQVATLEEIERHYSIDDVLTANDALDYLAAVNQEVTKRRGK